MRLLGPWSQAVALLSGICLVLAKDSDVSQIEGYDNLKMIPVRV
jgi:hypothetical protein